MVDRRPRSRVRRALVAVDGGLRTLGALVGTFPVAMLVAAALAAYLPLPAEVRFPIGGLLVVPLWVAAMCAAFLTPRGWQVWLAILALVALLAVLVPHAR
ncbi:MAG TPA: hypothetical protein VM734_11535 [Kofleriaceae bacterium]|jgi:hypothetical protein|nr:hypothetical protein [Kofleriaceae bacterium]